MSNLQIPSTLYVGNAVTTYCNFANPVAGETPNQWPLVDPSTVTLTFIPGSGEAPVTWTYGGFGSIVRTATGSYQAELATTGDGRWQAKWVGTGACAAVAVDGWQVAPVPF